MAKFVEPVVRFFNTYFPTTFDRLVIGAFALAALVALVLFTWVFVSDRRARRRASGDANAKGTRSAHLASLLDQLHESNPENLLENAVALFGAVGEIERKRQIDNERNPAFELTRFGGWMLVGLIALSLLGNATLGYAVYRGQMGQRAIAHDLVVTMERTTPLVGWGGTNNYARKEPIESRISYLIEAYLHNSDLWLASLPRQWLEENLDELNRILLLEKKQDTDGDGVVNTEDDCPNIPFGETASEQFPGCPITVATDGDGDGAHDFEDLCPNETGLSASWDLWNGYDSAGLWGASWRPAETMPEYLASTGSPHDLLRSLHYGCADKDEDGIVDTIDACPETHRGRYDKDLDGCTDPKTDVSTRWNFYKSPDDWATPERTDRDGHLAFRWFSITRADGVETDSFHVACLALDVDGKPIPKDAKEFQFGSYGECYIR